MRILILCMTVLVGFLASCGHKATPTGTTTEGFQIFGEKLTADSALSASQIISKLDAKENFVEVKIEGGNVTQGIDKVKVEGKVDEVCTHAGCWLTLKTDDGKIIFVKMKDHAYAVPKDIPGKTVVISGNAYQSITSVEELRHYEQDKGSPKEKIDAITEPKVEYKMTAYGVLVKS